MKILSQTVLVYLLAHLVVPVHGSTKLHATECRQKGFDTSNLACTTCDLLDAQPQLKATCLACCLPLRDISMITKPYEAAILVVPGGGAASEEVQKLLNDDWDALVERKGTTRLRRAETSAAQQQSFFYGPPPAYLYFFDINDHARANTLREFQALATESILLAGWKREDIRDMLDALLP